MGSNNNSNSGNQNQGYGPNANPSGSDPRGIGQNQSQYQQQRFENQQGPAVNAAAQNYGQGSEANMGDYTDIMNQYRAIASGNTGIGGGGGGYAGNQDYLHSPGTYTPFTSSYDDPFKSYAGYQTMSQTGGYSPEDVANLRERGTAPIRASYANAQREIDRQRSLSGGQGVNTTAALAKMAREQGQSMSDAMQNVEGGIVNQRNANQLAGLGGMSTEEQQRLAAQIQNNQFNAQQQTGAQQGNIGQDWALQQANSAIQARNLGAMQSAMNSSASAGAAAQNANLQGRLAALGGMTSLYGASPGMSSTFGNQLMNSIGQGGSFGNQLYGNDIANQRAPGQFDTTMGRINSIGGLVGQGLTAAYPFLGGGNQQPQGTPYNYSNSPTYSGGQYGYYGPTQDPSMYNGGYTGGGGNFDPSMYYD